jgi:steroid 5-alpha reductase family enzyme
MLATALLLLVLFLATWWLARHWNNYSIVDVVWALAFAPVALWHAFTGPGWLPRRVAVGALVAAWSLRLGLHLWRRVASHHPAEDARYAVLRARWQGREARAFLGFFLAQGLLVWLLMLPVGLIASATHPGFDPLEGAGLALWFIGLIGEAIADAQLARFKRRPGASQGVCDEGLWAWSRHPNYFFQSLLWWGLFLMALPSPWGWASVVAPIAMLHFLLNVTGIPLTEKLSLERRGEAYRAYQQRTSPFLPRPPRPTP